MSYELVKEASKELTREEFLNSKYIECHCPCDDGLEEFNEEQGCIAKNDPICKECWNEATKNIKFKGEYNVEMSEWLTKKTAELTKEEFFADKDNYKYAGCPKSHGLKNITKEQSASNCNSADCKECWEKAINESNIKFKENTISAEMVEKAKTMTKEEFAEYLKGKSECPKDYGLKDFCEGNFCTTCCERAVEESGLEFKDAETIQESKELALDEWLVDKTKTLTKEDFLADRKLTGESGCPYTHGIEMNCEEGIVCEDCWRKVIEENNIKFKEDTLQPKEKPSKIEFLCIADFHTVSGVLKYTAGKIYVGKEEENGEKYCIYGDLGDRNNMSLNLVKTHFVQVDKSFNTATAFLIVSITDLNCKRVSDELILSRRDKEYAWESGHPFLKTNDEWILVEEQKDQEVTFEEAVKAFREESKTIKCQLKDGNTYTYSCSDGLIGMTDQYGSAIGSAEILEGKWYIKA